MCWEHREIALVFTWIEEDEGEKTSIVFRGLFGESPDTGNPSVDIRANRGEEAFTCSGTVGGSSENPSYALFCVVGEEICAIDSVSNPNHDVRILIRIPLLSLLLQEKKNIWSLRQIP